MEQYESQKWSEKIKTEKPQGHVGQYLRVLHLYHWSLRNTGEILVKKRQFEVINAENVPNLRKILVYTLKNLEEFQTW